MGWIFSGVLLIACIILFIKYQKKQEIDRSELEEYREKLNNISQEINRVILEKKNISEAVEYEKYKLEEYRKDIDAAQDVYNNLVNNKMTEIDEQLERLRQTRLDEINASLEERRAHGELALQNTLQLYSQKEDEAHEVVTQTVESCRLQCEELEKQLTDQRNLFNSLLEPVKQYQKEKQEKLFYTIQLPEEFHDDIEFLLTTVAAKVQHPDIISKLVWTEYVKPNLDNTFKRIEIRPESGIYKLTSLETEMSYIGKSTDVKKRIADHFKSAVGIRSIADQAVHHAILKEGFWNWTIEIIQYCDKDDLNNLEKYYIDFFKTQEFGYNKNSGGGG